MTADDWDKMTHEQAARLVRAIYDPQFESREAFRHMNDVLDAHKAGKATEQEYHDAFAEFERLAREDGSMR